MPEPLLDCLTEDASGRPLFAIRPDGLDRFLAALPPGAASFLRDTGFTGRAGHCVLLPGPNGVDSAVVGLGEDRSPFVFGSLPQSLPPNSAWQLQAGDYLPNDAVLGFCLGGYRFSKFRPAEPLARLAISRGAHRPEMMQAEAIWMVRDLINTPANLLGPSELAEAAAGVGRQQGASVTIFAGEELARAYPTVAFVGAGSAREPCVVVLKWSGSAAHEDAPLVSLCGKGVCFDTGGYDLKPSSGMLRMKKDMGGAATALGLTRMIMEADLPIRLALRLGCVENAVSGTAMRPLDVVRTRAGLSVEIGNTDAEGRLVLCDLLFEACEEKPDLLLDFATLTGAAQVALGPELPAMFCNDEGWAERLLGAGSAAHDPLWRLPLWDGYEPWLKSSVADLNNVSSKPMAGAVIAALFLRRFVSSLAAWAHFDIYAWNDQTQPGRPEGGEAQAIRGIFRALTEFVADSRANRNMRVTSS